MSKKYERKHKEDKPVVAICYDFDKTLSPDDMQAQGYIQDVDYDVQKFWEESNKLAKENDMDTNLAYMYKMVEEAEGNFILNKEELAKYGSKVNLFPGVKEWFGRIKEYGRQKHVIIEHYIISSGSNTPIEWPPFVLTNFIHGISVSLSPMYIIFLNGTLISSGLKYSLTPVSFTSNIPFSILNRN